VLALPLALALPSAYRALGRVVDRAWLGRRFSPAEAVKRFLSGLQLATSEQDLVRHAENGLRTLFRAPVRIELGLREARDVDFDTVLDEVSRRRFKSLMERLAKP